MPTFDSVLDAAGAQRSDWFGVSLASNYGDLASEYSAFRSGCALVDARFRAANLLVGDDRASFLQGMVSNDVAGLTPGTGVHAAMLTSQGRVVSDLRVFCREDGFMLDVPVQTATLLRQTLERYIVADDVEFETLPAQPMLLLGGPRVFELLSVVAETELANAALGTHVAVEVDHGNVVLAKVSHGGAPGVLCFASDALAAELWTALRAAGATPAGLGALDIARVEAGEAWMGRDMDEERIAPEVGLVDAISFSKGCYIGQEVVERVASRGRVQRKLVGFRSADGSPLPMESKAFHGGDEVGFVTSAVVSPDLGPIALGYARRVAWAPGTAVELRSDETSVAAVVQDLPFPR